MYLNKKSRKPGKNLTSIKYTVYRLDEMHCHEVANINIKYNKLLQNYYNSPALCLPSNIDFRA